MIPLAAKEGSGQEGSFDGRGAGWPYYSAAALLLLYAAVFVVLSIDVMVRIWSWRERIGRSNLLTLFFFEVSRSAVTVGIIALVLYMLVRRNTPPWRPLALALGFAAVWHTKAFGFSAFPGALQESLALQLRARHTPTAVLVFVFGSPAWALWGAASCMLYFSAAFPRRLSVGDVEMSAGADRAGLLRSNALAGADIGDLFRRLSGLLLERDSIRPGAIAVCTLLWAAAFHVFGDHRIVLIAGALLLAGIGGLVVTNLRAARQASRASDRADNANNFNGSNADGAAVIRWLARGAMSGAALFGLSALAGLVFRGPDSVAGVLCLGLAPASVLYCVWRGVISGDARRGGHR